MSKKEPIEEKLKEEIKEELEKSSREIENVQHGHIYIKEAENLPEEKPPFFSKLLSGFSQTLVEVLNLIWEKTKNLFSGLFLRARSASFKPNFSKIDFRAAASYSKNLATDARNFGSKTNNLLKKFILFIFAVSKKELEKLKLLFQGSKRQAEIPFTFQVEANSSSEPVPTFKNKFNLLPDFGKIKELFSRFSYEQKIYALIILLLIFVVPYIGVKIENKIAARKAALISQNTPQEIVPLEQDKNVVRLPEPETINQEAGNISRIINLNQKIFFVGTSGIFDLDKKQVSPFPSEIGTAKNSAGMNDLNLILLITEDKKVFSFSPISGKYQSNQIEIPIEANPVSGETYLTYLYLLDSHANQIYRYPRAEGGFGTKVNWQKDDTDLSKVSDISVNENIFAVSSDAIIKLFKGKKQDFSVEETATPLSFDKIYVAKNNSEIYILDKKNSRIVRLSPEGNILTQYYSEKIKEASAFSVDEEKNIIYFSVEDKIFSFNIGQ